MILQISTYLIKISSKGFLLNDFDPCSLSITSVRKQGSERTEAGESALPAEESPWRLRALSRERELLEFYKKTASISSREREKRITLLAVVLIL